MARRRKIIPVADPIATSNQTTGHFIGKSIQRPWMIQGAHSTTTASTRRPVNTLTSDSHGSEQNGSTSAHPLPSSTSGRKPPAQPLPLNFDVDDPSRPNPSNGQGQIMTSQTQSTSNERIQASTSSEPPGIVATHVVSTNPTVPSLQQSHHSDAPLPNSSNPPTGDDSQSAKAVSATVTCKEADPAPTNLPNAHTQLATITTFSADSSSESYMIASTRCSSAPTSIVSIPVPTAVRSMTNMDNSSNTPSSAAPPRNIFASVQPQPPLDIATISKFRLNLREIVSRSRLTAEDKSHIAWVQDACQSPDHFSLLFHELFCLNYENQAILVARFGFSALHEPGWNVFAQIFGNTLNVSRPLLHLFVNGPYALATSSIELRLSAWIEHIKMFLARLGQSWKFFCALCSGRRVPPTVLEIIEFLGCPPRFALCRALYHSIELQINNNCDGPWLMKSNDLFAANFRSYIEMQKSPSQQADRANVSQQMVESFRLDYNRAFLNHHLQRRNVAVPIAQSLSLPAQPHSHHMRSPQPNQPQDFTQNSNAQQPHPSAVAPSHPRSLFTPTQMPVQSVQVPRGLFIPQKDHIEGPQAEPNPLRLALHQAHVWQPLTQVESHSSGALDRRLYQFICSMPLEPYQFSSKDAFFSCVFSVSENTFSRIVKTDFYDGASLERPKRRIGHGSSIINLRCVRLSTVQEDKCPSAWAAAPTTWPQHCFISVNGQFLELRRKRHYKRDLAVDISDYVRQGDNDFIVSIHKAKEEKAASFALAVEIVELSNEDHAMSLPTRLPKSESIALITKTMKPMARDPDIEVINSQISIDLNDPFTTRMFEIPVRGKSCHHRECFDLKTYLLSRPSDHQDELTNAYRWNCPRCSKDARPASLVIDEFLLEVRQKLVEQGKEDVKAILVKEDGSWQAKDESPAKDDGNREISTNGDRQQRQDDADEVSGATTANLGAEESSHGAVDCTPEIVDLDGD